MANAVFSQQPNILSGGGGLVVVPLQLKVNTVSFSGVPASGTFEFSYGGNNTAAINWNDSSDVIQTKLRAVTGLAGVNVSGSLATALVIQGYGVNSTLSTTAVSLQTSAPASITITVTPTGSGETIAAAITRTQGLVQYFGVMMTQTLDVVGQTDLLAAAAVIQPLNKIAFFVSHTQADIAPGGMLDLLRTGSFTQTRGLYYGDSSDSNDLVMMASYAGRGLSTNFSGSNTTSTMHLKVLNGVQPDSSMTQTILNEAIAAGADTYVSLQGVSCVFTSGQNRYFDQVYNQLWFAGALQIAGFNFLATSNTKVPQTEAGMDGLKGAYRQVCQLAVTNAYSAPGTWNSPTTFGNPTDLIQNVSQFGYYIYSIPIAQQLQVDRVARKAPLVSIALKEAGAIQQSSVIVYVNP
jgi:hypothetical protein